MNKEEFKEEIEETLKSLDNTERAKVEPFFYTRLTARLEGQKPTVTNFRWQWAMASVIVLLVLNGFAFSNFWPTDDEEEEIEWLADEYGSSYVDIYSSEDLEP